MTKQGHGFLAAADLLKLLEVRHSEDVFVPECKNGPSQGVSHLRMDAWAMKRSWSNPLTFGYEIKVSRADFKGDDKWHLYLPYCAEFYFVAMPNVIEVAELPPEAGLIIPSTNYSKLFVKKKAQRRQVSIPEDLFRYVLMCRTRVGPEINDERRANLEYWREWLENRKESRDIGWRVSRAVRDTVRLAEAERDQAIEKSRRADEVMQILRVHGLASDTMPIGRNVERQIKNLVSLLPSGIEEQIFATTQCLLQLKKNIDMASGEMRREP